MGRTGKINPKGRDPLLGHLQAHYGLRHREVNEGEPWIVPVMRFRFVKDYCHPNPHENVANRM